jgi:hypothetical protein
LKITGVSPRLSHFTSIAFGIVLLLVYVIATNATKVSAACAAPSTDYGTVTDSINVPKSGTYQVWTHMYGPSSSANSYMLEVDAGTCFTVGGGSSVLPGAWTWVDWQGGATSSTIDDSLTAGSHIFKLIGIAQGVLIDGMVLTTNASCVPSGNGSNCNISIPAPTTMLTAVPASVTPNSSSVLTWSSTNATACTASGGWSGNKAASGSISTGALTATTTFGLNCIGSGGTSTASTSVAVAAASSAPGTPGSPTPTTTVTVGQPGSGNQAVTGTVNLASNSPAGSSVTYEIDGDKVASPVVNTAKLADGKHTLTVKVVEPDGKTVTKEQQIIVNNHQPLWRNVMLRYGSGAVYGVVVSALVAAMCLVWFMLGRPLSLFDFMRRRWNKSRGVAYDVDIMPLSVHGVGYPAGPQANMADEPTVIRPTRRD